MLSDVKCRRLTLIDLELASGSDMRPIVIDLWLTLDNVRGDLEGLFRSTAFGVDQFMAFELQLRGGSIKRMELIWESLKLGGMEVKQKVANIANFSVLVF